MEILLGFIAGLGLEPLTALFAATTIGLVIYIGTHMRSESTKEKELRDKIETLLEDHTETVQALQENRITDLKDLIDRNDTTLKSLTVALNKIGKKS
jgi:hypothetical protein